MRISLHKREQGMAVVAALVVVVAASVIAASMINFQNVLAHSLMNERAHAQSKFLVRGGVDWARVILHADGKKNAITRLDSAWAQPIIGLEIGTLENKSHAKFSGRIEDEQGKYNLRNLMGDGEVSSLELDTLANLLGSLDIPRGLEHSIVGRIVESHVTERTGRSALGLRSIADLRELEGMTDDTIATLERHLSVLPTPTAVNVNTASAAVLSAISPGLTLSAANELIAERERGLWFKDRADFISRTGSHSGLPSERITVRSDWFLVYGEVVVSDTVTGIRALLHRRGNQLPVIRWMIN